MIETGLAGKVILITGATNPYGISAGAAYAFAAQGAKLFLNGHRGDRRDTQSQSVPPAETIEEPKERGEAFYNFDVADMTVFLASDQARWLTGQTMHVGGGHFM